MAVVAAVLTAVSALPAAAGAATVVPDTPLDAGTATGNCSLREAIHHLNDGGGPDDDGCTSTGTFGTNDTVALVAGTDYMLEVPSTGNENENVDGDLDIFGDLTITGDADNPPAIRNTVTDRVLDTPNSSDLTLQSLTVEDGQFAASANRGANIRYQGAAGETLTLDDVTVRNGSGTNTDARGGAISAVAGGHVVIRNGSVITQNTIGSSAGNFYYGGGIYVGGAGTDLTVDESTISDNNAGVAIGVPPAGGAGGGIYSDATGASVITLTDATIDGNHAGGGSSGAADGYGGGIALGNGGAGTTSSLQVTGGSVTDNIAAGGFSTGQGRGGGIFAEGTATGFSLDGALVTGNKAGGGGGSGSGLGGGLYSDRDLSVTGGSVSMNEVGTGAGGATGVGGGILVNTGSGDSDLTLDDTAVNNNLAGEFLGAGGTGGGVAMTSPGTLTVTGSAISNNNAYVGSGGGIYRESSSLTSDDSITGSTVAGNSASGGGGIYIREEDSPLEISASTVRTNSANGGAVDGGGGGVYTESDLTVTNSTVANNQANGAGGPGGGIRTKGTDPTLVLEHVTMSGNLTNAAGGNLYLEGGLGDASIRASIIGAGTATGTPSTSRCSQDVAGLIDSGGFNLEAAGDQCGFDAGGDLTAVSNGELALGLLADNGGPTETLAIGIGSVALDRVTSGCPPPATDQRGEPRLGPGCDTGAFEYPYETLTVSASGTGTGTVTGTGISCPGDCTQDVIQGGQVTLTAAATGGSVFAGWTGACSGTGPCSVTLDSPKSVGGSFTAPATKPKCKKGFTLKKVKKKGKKPKKKCVKVKKKRKK